MIRRVQDLEELNQLGAEVRPIFAGLIPKVVLEHSPLWEDARVVREKAEQKPNQQPLEGMPIVATLLKGVVQSPHQFGGKNVDRVLVLEDPFFNAEDKTEPLNVFGEVGKVELGLVARVEVEQVEGLEVAQQDVAGKVLLL